MSDTQLRDLLQQLQVPEFIQRAANATLARTIAAQPNQDTDQPQPERFPRLAFVYESEALSGYLEGVAARVGNDDDSVRLGFASAFTCWQALTSLWGLSSDADPRSSVSKRGVEIIFEEFKADLIPSYLALAFRLAVSGLLAKKSAETRLELGKFDISVSESADWRERVSHHVFAAVVFLTRKNDGWTDIDHALSSIDELRLAQEEFEQAYLDKHETIEVQAFLAAELVGLYHLAQIVTTTGEYLRDGIESISQIRVRLDRHRDRAREAFQAAMRAANIHLVDLLWCGCRELVQNSIWNHISGLGEQARSYAELLVSRGRPNPVMELWPSQQEALRKNLLDPYRRAVLVEMPTSAGKTLLAKFSIVQTKALNPNGVIAYIVPTRALVNQITLDLRADFRGLEPPLQVEQAVPAFELDPTEELLLSNGPDIIVTTPEKLDLLVRRNHIATQNIALIIVDEAHNLREGTRGARLELLLGMIKRDRPGARFLLLSPFLPNDEELVQWLGEGRALPPISIDWKLGRRIVGTVRMSGARSNKFFRFASLPAADNTDLKEPIDVVIGPGSAHGESATIEKLSRATCRALGSRGAVLILCRGKGTAMSRAQEIASDRPTLPETPQREAVCRYLAAEAGRSSPLADHIRKGVAYHHAGLSHEARWLIEGLIRQKSVSVICGTTTLAQGMNFPITTVIVETLKKGTADLTYQDFWNIAGRAGRTLVDSVGVVVFPATSKAKQQEYADFLQGEAQEISSQLATLLSRADELAGRFDLQTLRDWPQLLSLFQFLAHAMRISGKDSIADEVEDILRASLIYYQAQRNSDAQMQGLIRLCRAYLQQIQGQNGILVLADQTGFATPSVVNLLRQVGNSRELHTAANWRPERLFGNDIRPLQQRIELISNLPEMMLGQGSSTPFDAERIARILRDWVKGDTLSVLAGKYHVGIEKDEDKRVATFSQYLFSDLLGRASWGLGALEGISLAGQDSGGASEDAGYIPSMIFFGVQKKEAVWLRMVGVPRVVADGLADLWQTRRTGAPQTYDEIRTWVAQLSNSEWEDTIPKSSTLTADDMRSIWTQFIG